MPTPSECIAMGVVMPIANAAILILRFFARYGTKQFGVDDALILFAFVLSLGIAIILIIGAVSYGYGLNGPATTPESGYTSSVALLLQTKKITNFVNYLQGWVLGSTKLSIICFYRRIFRGKAFNVISISAMCIVTAWMLCYFFLALFQCGIHIEWLWSSAQNIAENCLEGAPIALFFSSTDVATDVMILTIPVYWTLKLQISRAKKILICGIFFFGALAALASVARLIVYILIYPSHNSNPNQYGYATDVAYFSMLEVGLAIIAACLPTLGMLLTDAQRGRLSNAMSSLFLRDSSRSSGTKTSLSTNGLRKKRSNVTSVSETQFVPKDSYEARTGVETFAMGDVERAPSHDDGLIVVRTDTDQVASYV